jgi:hypothetical protein
MRRLDVIHLGRYLSAALIQPDLAAPQVTSQDLQAQSTPTSGVVTLVIAACTARHRVYPLSHLELAGNISQPRFCANSTGPGRLIGVSHGNRMDNIRHPARLPVLARCTLLPWLDLAGRRANVLTYRVLPRCATLTRRCDTGALFDKGSIRRRLSIERARR